MLNRNGFSLDGNTACYLIEIRGGDRGRALASRGKKWSGVANNMQLLREGSWERRTRGDRLYMEVARKQEGGLANLG